MNNCIDFEAIGATVDLQALIVADLGAPDRGKKWHCPYHQDENPSLSLTPDRCHWKCWSCGSAGDALDWVARREGLDLAEAARRLDPLADQPAHRKPAPPPKPAAVAPVWHDRAWQAAVERIVLQAEARLWSPDGLAAVDWLRSRGLADHVIRRFRIGFVSRDFNSEPVEVLGLDDRGRVRSIRVRRGVTIPWIAPGANYVRADDGAEGPPRWVGCNVRRLATDPVSPLPDGEHKCQALRGSMRGHAYPWPEILPTQGVRPALLAEGEIDSLLAQQEVGHLVYAATVGGASQGPDPTALLALARCPQWLLAHDHDGPGVEAAARWKSLAPHKSRRVLLPFGKDLGAFVEGGGDVLGWLKDEFDRLGLAWPPASRGGPS